MWHARGLAAWLLVALAAPALKARAEELVDYHKQIKPILARCFSCHGALKQEGELRLDAASLIQRGGASGALVIPGNSAQSLLIERVASSDAELRMPRDGKPLSEEEIAVLKAWIDQGAKLPQDEAIPPDPRLHWSFLPPKRPPLPDVADVAWANNPVDRLIAAAHRARGLRPLPVADKAVLLRRVYVDLVGLPPTREELHAFLQDEAPDAYERVVDRLLHSPRYGERWGRHFMDVWRYSDWYGYGNEIRNSMFHIWRWRDWIVESFNANKPYDQMIVEMLAADEARPDDLDALRATGFLGRNWYKFNRNVWLQDTIEHTGKALLGLTLNCARCHDHMYDPISQADYFRLRAVFEPHDVRTDRLPGQPDVLKDGLPRAYDANPAAPTYFFIRGDDRKVDKETTFQPALPAFLGKLEVQPVELPPDVWYPGLKDFIRQETLAAARRQLQTAESALAAKRQAFAAAEAAVALASDVPPEDDPAAAADRKPAVAGNLLMGETFAEPQPARWQTASGQWEHQGGKLLQKQVGASIAELVYLPDVPKDFVARFDFTTTGGQMWKSVGLSFDRVDAANFDGVYLSAYAGGPKLQFLHYRNGASSYPQKGAAPFPATLNRTYQLDLAVQDKLVNVWLDGQLVLAYHVAERRDGKLALWTFDAAAEFTRFELYALADGARLADSAGAAAVRPVPPHVALQRARAELALAEAARATAQCNLAWVEARIAADQARYSQPPAANAQELALAAGTAQLELAVFKAREQQLQAEYELQQAKDAKAAANVLAEAEKKLAAANKAHDDAVAARQKPSGNYEPLSPQYPQTSTGRRLALARWIANRNNPLTARVAVNHVWLRHFGQPLVPTVFDFGLHGKPASHPELLDYLAVEFMEHGWDFKWLHKLLVTSRTYQLRSSAPPNEAATAAANAAIDPDNRLLWRANLRRMESEAVRDALLHVSGRLDTTMGGPDIDQTQGETVLRRSIYLRHAHEKQMEFLKLFDAPNINECYQRTESMIPQQALALANSALSLEGSRVLARKLGGEAPSAVSDADFIRGAFEQILCRPPTQEEHAECERFLADQAQRLSDPKSLVAFDGPGRAVPPSSDPRQRARENLVHVLLNHHEFVTIR